MKIRADQLLVSRGLAESRTRAQALIMAGAVFSNEKKLAKAGADLLICLYNTIHQAMRDVRPRSPLPWLHIAEVVAEEATRRRLRKPGLLGTKWLVQSEVYPAAYAAIAANEAEKAAEIHLLELITFGAFGRLWLGGWEAEIKAAVAAAEGALAKISGREAKS